MSPMTRRRWIDLQALARRLLARLPDYFAGLGATAGTPAARSIVVVSSGVDRAVDSAGLFAGSLAAAQTSLAALITAPPAPVGYPASAPVVQPAGSNRFLLYFHKLVAKTDLVTDPADPMYATYQRSLAFQTYANDPDMIAAVDAILAAPAAVTAARSVLERLFTPRVRRPDRRRNLRVREHRHVHVHHRRRRVRHDDHRRR